MIIWRANTHNPASNDYILYGSMDGRMVAALPCATPNIFLSRLRVTLSTNVVLVLLMSDSKYKPFGLFLLGSVPLLYNGVYQS